MEASNDSSCFHEMQNFFSLMIRAIDVLNDIFVFFEFSIHDHVSHLLGVLLKSQKAPISSSYPSVCPHETTRLLLD